MGRLIDFRSPGIAVLAIVLLLLVAESVGLIDLSGDDGDEPELGRSAEAGVERVIDGDTIEVSLGGEEEDVRYIGIDTPESVAPGEPVECFGKAASRENERLVGGETVRLVFDAERRDDYGRLLAYVYVDELFVNAKLVETGFARTLEIAPNTTQAERLNRLEAEAGSEGLGLWGACEA
ncbi:MAG: thermonuclease family protein [Solirubrobacterales bacterium]